MTSHCEPECPVKLEVNLAGPYVENAAGVIEARVTNLTDKMIDKAVIEVDFRFVSELGRHEVKRLPAGGTSECFLSQLAGMPPGTHVVTFHVAIHGPQDPLAYTGREKVEVEPKRPGPQNVSIQPHFDDNFARAQAGTVNVLLSAGGAESGEPRGVEPDWKAVRLVQDDERTEGPTHGPSDRGNEAKRPRTGRSRVSADSADSAIFWMTYSRLHPAPKWWFDIPRGKLHSGHHKYVRFLCDKSGGNDFYHLRIPVSFLLNNEER